MSTIVVRYRPRPDAADTNQALVEDVPSAPPSTSAVTPTMDPTPSRRTSSAATGSSTSPNRRPGTRTVGSAPLTNRASPNPRPHRRGPGRVQPHEDSRVPAVPARIRCAGTRPRTVGPAISDRRAPGRHPRWPRTSPAGDMPYGRVMPYPSARSQRCWGDNVEVQDLTVPYDVGGYLSEHLRPAQVSAVSQSGSPLLGSLWFLWVDRRFWFSSVSDSPLVRAFQNGSEVAVLVDDFSPPVDIRQVRVRGPARVERHDPARVKEIYERYLGADVDTWPGGLRNRLDDLNYIVWSVTPVSGVVASFAHFKGEEARWSNYDNCPLPEATPSPPPPAAKPLPPS